MTYSNIKKEVIRLMREGMPPEEAVVEAYTKAGIKPPKLKTTPVKPKTYIVNILPVTYMFDGKLTSPLSDNKFRSIVVKSLKDWVSKAKPGLIKEHTPDGGSYGVVSGIFEDSKGIFAKIEVTDAKVIEGMESKRYRFVSPTIAWSFKADDYSHEENNVWPAALLEVSLVSIPRHFTRQVEIKEDKSILSQYGCLNYNDTTSISQLAAELTEDSDTYLLLEEDLTMDMKELMRMLGEMLDEKLDPIMKRLEVVERDSAEGRDDVRKEEEPVVETEASEEVVEEPVELAEEPVEPVVEEVAVEEPAPVEEEPVEEEPVDPRDEEIAKLKEMLASMEKASVMSEAKVAELNEAIKVRDAKAQVSSDIAGKPHLSQMSEKLVNIYMKDSDLYNEVVSLSGGESTRSILSERSTVGYVPIKEESSNPYDMAHKISVSEGVSYKEALSGLLK